MIDALQGLVFIKSDNFLPSIEKSIEQHRSTFTYNLFLLIDDSSQRKQNAQFRKTNNRSDNEYFRLRKFQITLLDDLIFTNKNYLFID